MRRGEARRRRRERWWVADWKGVGGGVLGRGGFCVGEGVAVGIGYVGGRGGVGCLVGGWGGGVYYCVRGAVWTEGSW